MAAAAHGRSKKVPKSVAKEFHKADKKSGILKAKRKAKK
jgi:hypothetical protein